jgi:hypothetical protein
MVTGWLTRLVVTLTILGIIAFDGISVAGAHFQASDDADQAAQAAATAYHQPGATESDAFLAAEKALSSNERLVQGSFQIAADGTVTLSVRRTAKSLLLHLWSATRGWAVVTESGSAEPPSS